MYSTLHGTARKLLLTGLLLVVTVGASGMSLAATANPFAEMFRNPAVFREAIERERPARTMKSPISGITVPHHLLAADLIARGFWAASATKVDRIILLSPDHFRRAKRAFATTPRPFRTALGNVEPDSAVISTLLRRADLFENSNLFEHEHGVAAVLPFAAHFFPRAKVVPIAISPDARKADWERAVALFLSVFGPGTLIVQSTDFSHYLPSWVAQQRDQETLHVLSANNPDQVASLVASDHLDSKGAQFIQMRLQAARGATGPIVIGNRNASEYTHVDTNSTSYIVQLFSPHTPDPADLQYSDQQITFFGGDTLFGRYLTQGLIETASREAMFEAVHRLTGGLPFIVNLEGVVLEELPEQLPQNRHVMPRDLAERGLKALNVVAAGLANNHSFDLGPIGLEETLKTLQQAGVRALRHGEIVDLGRFRAVALNFISKNQIPGFPVVRDGDLSELCRQGVRPPLIAFVHWGTEYQPDLGPAEYAIASQLQDCGVTAIIGAHSHRASASIEVVQGGAQQIVASLGNMLFDQNGSIASGSLLELRVFEQGTMATRLLPLPNLYDIGRRELSRNLNSSVPGPNSAGNTAD